MRNGKNYIKILIGGIISLFIVIIVIQVIKNSKKAKRNVKNCEKVVLGMPKETVDSIMGQPDQVSTYKARINYKDKNVILLNYSAPFLASSGVDVYLDRRTKKVLKVVCKD